jgi:ABC-type branched-subunit amino acid transport system ATPase component
MGKGLVLKNINKRFGDFWVLCDVCATVPAGKITAFIGPNGAGKTTLFHVIAGILKPDSGSVRFGKLDITGMPTHAVARIGIGRQFQDVRAFGGLSVLENVMLASLPNSVQSAWRAWFCKKISADSVRVAQQKALRWIEYVGLRDMSRYLAKDLSFGQQKLLSLARLFAKGSQFLLLDEPTAGLSHNMVEQITSLIHRAVNEQNVTVALIEHNVSVVSNLAFWIHFMHEGRVAFSGERGHVLGNQNVREMYIGM